MTIVPSDNWYEREHAIPNRSGWVLIVPEKDQPMQYGLRDTWCFGKEPIIAYFESFDHHGMEICRWWVKSTRNIVMWGGKNGYVYCRVNKWQPLSEEVLNTLPAGLDPTLLKMGMHRLPHSYEVPIILAFHEKYRVCSKPERKRVPI